MPYPSGDLAESRVVDLWTAAPGFMWFTPENYDFDTGDFVFTISFTHLDRTQPEDSFLRADAFYFCGAGDPLGFVSTSGLLDFGTFPGNQPGYGWLFGIGYEVHLVGEYELDWATRTLWNGIMDAGVPLAGRPDCACINMSEWCD